MLTLVCVCVCVSSTTSVDYLEGDLGQTEFTPAGCLSLSTVKEPILGGFEVFPVFRPQPAAGPTCVLQNSSSAT